MAKLTLASNESFADFQQEIFGISLRLFHNPAVVAIFQRGFLQQNFDGILGLVSFCDQHAGAVCEGRASPLLCRERLGFGLALVLAKPRGR
ncbi:MAG: hypothetical protein WA628_15565 [Terriglobales bacterium]